MYARATKAEKQLAAGKRVFKLATRGIKKLAAREIVVKRVFNAPIYGHMRAQAPKTEAMAWPTEVMPSLTEAKPCQAQTIGLVKAASPCENACMQE